MKMAKQAELFYKGNGLAIRTKLVYESFDYTVSNDDYMKTLATLSACDAWVQDITVTRGGYRIRGKIPK